MAIIDFIIGFFSLKMDRIYTVIQRCLNKKYPEKSEEHDGG